MCAERSHAAGGSRLKIHTRVLLQGGHPHVRCTVQGPWHSAFPTCIELHPVLDTQALLASMVHGSAMLCLRDRQYPLVARSSHVHSMSDIVPTPSHCRRRTRYRTSRRSTSLGSGAPSGRGSSSGVCTYIPAFLRTSSQQCSPSSLLAGLSSAPYPSTEAASAGTCRSLRNNPVECPLRRCKGHWRTSG